MRQRLNVKFEGDTGIHDAVNLGWKLIMVLKGWAGDDLLKTYAIERRSAAQRLIDFDRQISALMSNKWPEGFPKHSDADINAVLASKFDEAAGLNTGLNVSYNANLINVVSDAGPRIAIRPGFRAPDATLLKVGTLQPTRLQDATPNRGIFYVVAFTGEPRITYPGVLSFSKYLGQSNSLKSVFPSTAVELISIVSSANTRLAVEDALGIEPFGRVYFDEKGRAHSRYGVSLRGGALVALRPDGYVAFVAELSESGGKAMTEYLTSFLFKKPCLSQKL